MSKQPPTNDNQDTQFDADLEAIENAMNNIMQGAFSSMFRQLIDSSIFEDAEKSGFPGAKQIGDTITTVFDGRNLNSRVPASTVVEEDGYGGSDFKRLARKSKESRGITATSTEETSASRDMVPSSSAATAPSPAGLIFNLLFQQPPAEIFSTNRDALPVTHTSSKDTPSSQDEVSCILLDSINLILNSIALECWLVIHIHVFSNRISAGWDPGNYHYQEIQRCDRNDQADTLCGWPNRGKQRGEELILE